MVTKTYYLAQRKNNASFIIPNGRVNFRFNFQNGNVIEMTPPTYSTANPFYQSVIEGSELFEKGIIKIAHVVSDTDTGQTGASLVQVLSVTSVSQAIDYIADNYQAKVTNFAQASSFAAEHGFCFPNIRRKNQEKSQE